MVRARGFLKGESWLFSLEILVKDDIHGFLLIDLGQSKITRSNLARVARGFFTHRALRALFDAVAEPVRLNALAGLPELSESSFILREISAI